MRRFALLPVLLATLLGCPHVGAVQGDAPELGEREDDLAPATLPAEEPESFFEIGLGGFPIALSGRLACRRPQLPSHW